MAASVDKADKLAQEMTRFEQELLGTAVGNGIPKPLFPNSQPPPMQRARGPPPGPPRPPSGPPPMRPQGHPPARMPSPAHQGRQLMAPPRPPQGLPPKPPPVGPPARQDGSQHWGPVGQPRLPPGPPPSRPPLDAPPLMTGRAPVPQHEFAQGPPQLGVPQLIPAQAAPPQVIPVPTPIPVVSLQVTAASHPGGAEAAPDLSALSKPKKPLKAMKMKRDPKKLRMGGGKVWEDHTLDDWDQDDFRIFVGDLGNDVNDDTLARSFSKYQSFLKAKVIRDKYTKKTKGYGFVSFKSPQDFMQAMKEMNGKYIGNRPIKLRKSTWKDRAYEAVKKKEKEKKRLGFR